MREREGEGRGDEMRGLERGLDRSRYGGLFRSRYRRLYRGLNRGLDMGPDRAGCKGPKQSCTGHVRRYLRQLHLRVGLGALAVGHPDEPDDLLGLDRGEAGLRLVHLVHLVVRVVVELHGVRVLPWLQFRPVVVFACLCVFARREGACERGHTR
jgi:hypothetical protein